MTMKALVVMSGGQDSTTCLYWALNRYGGPNNVSAVFFKYGQRHYEKERVAVDILTARAAVLFTELDLGPTFSQLGGALVDQSSDIGVVNPGNNLPASFVPGRNIIFLTCAAALAYREGIGNLVIGVCETDYSGYPDCRHQTIDAISMAISRGMDRTIAIQTPLMHISKRQTVELADHLGCLDELKYSWTCYEGGDKPCGKCPACILRAKGFEEAGIKDPALEL